jgi:integrase
LDADHPENGVLIPRRNTGKQAIERVSYGDLQAVVADLERRPTRMGEKMAVGTINRYLTAASAVLTFAQSMGYRKDTPDIPWRKEAKQGRFHWLTEDQERAVCSALVDHGYAIEAFCVRVLCATGLRWGEFAGLETGQIEDQWIRLWETKTDTPRSVPIHNELARELRANILAGRMPKYDTFGERFARAVKVCGYDPALTPHCLRHTTCTRLINGGLPMPKVERFMDHKSIQTTMRYFHMMDDDLAEVANILSPHRGENGEGAKILKIRTK